MQEDCRGPCISASAGFMTEWQELAWNWVCSRTWEVSSSLWRAGVCSEAWTFEDDPSPFHNGTSLPKTQIWDFTRAKGTRFVVHFCEMI